MSRAYCMTCNEQVHETAGGTCPLGHPVTAHDHGPEPWVGFAGTGTATSFADDQVDDHAEDPVPMERIDALGRPVAHAGARANGHANGHVNGAVNGHALGGGHGDHDPFPSTFGHRSAFQADTEPAPPTERAPATGEAADDLAALLAEALATPTPEDTAPEVDTAEADPPVADEPVDTTSEEDWGDLAGLAAELQLDADHAVDDGPAAPTAAADHEVTWDGPAPDTASWEDLSTDEGSWQEADIDELLAELTGGHAAADPVDEVEGSLAPEPGAAAPPPPPPPPPTAAPLPGPAPVAVPEPAPDPVAPVEDVGSAAPAADDLSDLWDQTTDLGTDDDDVAPAPQVDLTNFTAHGRRVGGSGGTTPARKSARSRTFGRRKKG